MESNNINVLTVNDIARIMKIGRNKAYEVFNMRDFPSFSIGRLLRVYESDFIRWLNEQTKQ